MLIGPLSTYCSFQELVMRICRSLLLTISLVFPCSFFGQSTNAALTGVVDDPSKAVIAGAQITAINTETGVKSSTTTNNSGVYVLPALIPGAYRIEVDKQGFKGIIEPGLVLHVQDVVQLNFHMALGSMTETVTVEANGLNINTTDATVKTTIDRNFAENIPMNGRSFQTLLMITPGVVFTNASVGGDAGQFSVNGQRADTNYFAVDGVGANFGVTTSSSPAQSVGGTVPAFTALGGTNSLVPVDALQEFTIQTSSYGAENGRSPGGQISIETRSGTNDFHWTAFDYLRNDIFDANNWFNGYTNNPPLPKGKERQNDFGGVFGGPIVKDRTFFFAAYEGLRLLQPTTNAGVVVPSLCLRGAGGCQAGESPAAAGLQPILQSFPLPSGPEFVDSSGNPTGAAPFTESISNPSSIDTGTIRIDQAVGKRLLLFGRYSDSNSATGVFLSGGPISNVTDARIKTLTIGTNWNATSKFTNSLRFNYSSEALLNPYSLVPIGGGRPFDTSIMFPPYVTAKDGQATAAFVLGGSVFYLQVGSALQTRQKQWNVLDSSTYLIKNHELKFGVDYRRLTPDFKGRSYIGTAIFFSEATIQSGTADSFGVAANREVQPRFTNLSLYIEDTWKLSSRFTLNYGVRYELNPVPSEAHGIRPLNVIGLDNPPTAALAPSNAPLYNTRYGNFAPRLGFAYQMSRSPQFATVLRSGLGMFYDLGADSVASGYSSIPFNFNQQYSNVPFPSANLPGPPTFALTPPFDQIYGIDPHLRLPYTLQWNVTLEQALGANQSLSVGYVAAAGRNLLRQDDLYNFSPNFLTVYGIRNAASSDYDSLQMQFKRRLTHGLQALASYTYAHSIDNASNGVSPSDSTSTFMNPNLDRGSSDFDVRHTVTGAATYELPKPTMGAVGRAMFGGWSTDTIAIARSSLPVNLVGGLGPQNEMVRPDLIAGIPLRVQGPQFPGGREINPGAFARVPTNANGFPLRQGTLGRNAVRGLGAWQIDFALHRQFDLGERLKVQFRAEAFNVFNHPNFGSIDPSVGDGRFGQATSMLSQSYGEAGLNSLYQIGGPRSIQLALKLVF
jgi:hypothetical protein